MSDAVLDASAFLCLLWDEPGAEAVAAVLPGALMSTVNVAEVVAKLSERGMSGAAALATIDGLGVDTVDFDRVQAAESGALRVMTRAKGLSLGDRACLTLSRQRNCPAVTADAAWADVAGFDVKLIRRRAPR